MNKIYSKKNTFTLLILISLILLSSITSLIAQEEKEELEDIYSLIILDPLVVTAQKEGFDVEQFIKMVEEDKSFYKAFKNIRRLSYSSENDIQLYHKKGKQLATYHSFTHQQSDGKCRLMQTEDEMVEGNFYKKKKAYRYYTAKLYDRVFFTHGKRCEQTPNEENVNQEKEDKGGMEKHISELKKLIFNPGQEANVPIIGKRTALFSKRMSKYYDYAILSKPYKGEVDCYVFTATVKPEYQEKQKDRTVIKYLETYFEKTNNQVVARSYQLQYFGTLFDFDVKMEVELIQKENLYLPEFISYDGMWNIPAKKPEIAKFKARFYDYKLP